MNNSSGLKEYDQRQFRLMLQTIGEYHDGHMKLGRLVSSLDAIYCALENPKQDFRNRFECDWGKLEDTNAIMLDQERMYLNEFDKELVQRALRDLEVLIASQLDSI